MAPTPAGTGLFGIGCNLPWYSGWSEGHPGPVARRAGPGGTLPWPASVRCRVGAPGAKVSTGRDGSIRHRRLAAIDM